MSHVSLQMTVNDVHLAGGREDSSILPQFRIDISFHCVRAELLVSKALFNYARQWPRSPEVNP